MRRVVITGIGLVCPLGASYDAAWKGLLGCKSGVSSVPIDIFDVSNLPSRIGGFVRMSDPYNESSDHANIDDFIPRKERRKMDRFMHWAVIAAQEAMQDSGYVVNSEEKAYRSGTIIGSGIGGVDTIAKNSIAFHEGGARKVSPFFIPASLINLAPGHVSMKHSLKGPSTSVVTACASGAHSIGDAANFIKCGYADMMLAGGVEALAQMSVAGFCAMKALSTRFNDSPEKASRPWDEDRDGFVISEGAAMLVLEEYDSAKNRGANIYGEILGYGMTADAYHITVPDGVGSYRAMKMALETAKLNTEDIGYINAHGTSTPVGDEVELHAVQKLFIDESSSAHKGLVMSSTKSSIGHMLGAAGSAEAIFSLLALKNQVVPPTLNLDNPPKDFKIDLVPHAPKDHSIKYVMSNSFGFGGTNASLVFGAV